MPTCASSAEESSGTVDESEVEVQQGESDERNVWQLNREINNERIPNTSRSVIDDSHTGSRYNRFESQRFFLDGDEDSLGRDESEPEFLDCAMPCGQK
jgi:hypothetical protein